LRNVLLNPNVPRQTFCNSRAIIDRTSSSSGEELEIRIASATIPFHVTPSLAPGLIDEILR
jgi:hypothetical protein